jgi:hypothetical protein
MKLWLRLSWSVPFGENPAASDGAEHVVSLGGEDILSEGAPDDTKLRTCYFGSSTITVSKIKEMEERGYFPEDKARTLGAKTVQEPNGDETMVYEDFFIIGLGMPPHPALADILLHF